MLEAEEAIVKELCEHFPEVTATVQRERRIWMQTPREKFLEVLSALRDELGFISLCTVTGLDLGEEFQLIYHLARPDGIMANVKENAPKSDPVFHTASDLFRGGVIYELEARNLLGLQIPGIPPNIRYPLPDNWLAESYPLRKDWAAPTPDVGGDAHIAPSATAHIAPSATAPDAPSKEE